MHCGPNGYYFLVFVAYLFVHNHNHQHFVEEIHELKWKVQKLTEANRDMAERLDNSDMQVKEQQKHINMLNKRFTTKYRVEERNDWRALVDSLNNDRRELNEQLDAMRTLLSSHSHSYPMHIRTKTQKHAHNSPPGQHYLKSPTTVQEKTSLEAQLLKARESAVHYRSRMTELEAAEAAEANDSQRDADRSTEVDTNTNDASGSDDATKLLEHLQQERLRLQQELLREKQRAQERDTAAALELQNHKQEVERLKLENQLLQEQVGKAKASSQDSGGFFFGLGAAFGLCAPTKKKEANFDLSTTI